MCTKGRIWDFFNEYDFSVRARRRARPVIFIDGNVSFFSPVFTVNITGD